MKLDSGLLNSRPNACESWSVKDDDVRVKGLGMRNDRCSPLIYLVDVKAEEWQLIGGIVRFLHLLLSIHCGLWS